MKFFKKLKSILPKVSTMSQRYTAFTLAEVLIILGIIGIIAAITLPTLINNIQDMQYKQAAKEAYSKSSQVIKQIIQNNGGVWDDTVSPSTFANNFSSYLKRLDSFQPGQNANKYVAGANNSTVYKALYKNQGGQTWWMVYQFQSVDGMFWAVNFWSPPTTQSFSITVDVNGYLKAPNVYGEDVFMFQVINGNLLPMGSNNTSFPATSYCQRDLNNGGGSQGLGCMYYVMQGINY